MPRLSLIRFSSGHHLFSVFKAAGTASGLVDVLDDFNDSVYDDFRDQRLGQLSEPLLDKVGNVVRLNAFTVWDKLQDPLEVFIRAVSLVQQLLVPLRAALAAARGVCVGGVGALAEIAAF